MASKRKIKIGLIDFDGKIVNLALMKLSAWHKSQDDTVILNPQTNSQVDKAYCSVIFSKNRDKAARLADMFSDIQFGGTGWDLKTILPPEIEAMKPDYGLYTCADVYKRLAGIMTKKKKVEKAGVIVNAGIGFTSRGCIRSCGFCVVPEKEGKLHETAAVGDLINPKSNVVILLDNNFTASPDCLDKLREIKERNLIIDITQGIDVRTLTPEIARALSEVRHLRSIHYAWDLIPHEPMVMEGINILSGFIKKYKHLCFTLVGYNSTFEEDLYRFRKLEEMNIDPYVMVYNSSADVKLHHFARWVNSRIYKTCKSFEDYWPWVKYKEGLNYVSENC